MNTIAKKFGIAMLTAATAFAPLASTAAHAGDRRWIGHDYRVGDPGRIVNYREYSERRYGDHHRRIYRHRDNSDAIALGIIGLGVGAIIGGAIANSHNQPRVIYRDQPRIVRGGSYEPWTASWVRYCTQKYRSFNRSTGTYRGYDGRDHFCVAN